MLKLNEASTLDFTIDQHAATVTSPPSNSTKTTTTTTTTKRKNAPPIRYAKLLDYAFNDTFVSAQATLRLAYVNGSARGLFLVGVRSVQAVHLPHFVATASANEQQQQQQQQQHQPTVDTARTRIELDIAGSEFAYADFVAGTTMQTDRNALEDEEEDDDDDDDDDTGNDNDNDNDNDDEDDDYGDDTRSPEQRLQSEQDAFDGLAKLIAIGGYRPLLTYVDDEGGAGGASRFAPVDSGDRAELQTGDELRREFCRFYALRPLATHANSTSMAYFVAGKTTTTTTKSPNDDDGDLSGSTLCTSCLLMFVYGGMQRRGDYYSMRTRLPACFARLHFNVNADTELIERTLRHYWGLLDCRRFAPTYLVDDAGSSSSSSSSSISTQNARYAHSQLICFLKFLKLTYKTSTKSHV